MQHQTTTEKKIHDQTFQLSWEGFWRSKPRYLHEKNNVKGIILPSYMYDVYMHIGIILKLTRHEPIRNSWNVIRILNVAQMGYEIEVPIGQIGHVSFQKSRVFHQNFHRFSLKSKPKIRCFSPQKNWPESMEFRICFLQQNVAPNWQRAPKRQDMSTIRLRVGGTERGVSGSTFCVGFLG